VWSTVASQYPGRLPEAVPTNVPFVDVALISYPLAVSV
jgi:hypothetical protein